jgi:hypothetical protein
VSVWSRSLRLIVREGEYLCEDTVRECRVDVIVAFNDFDKTLPNHNF